MATVETLPAGAAYVKTDGLTLRRGPGADRPAIHALDLGERVEVLGTADDPRWRRVRVGGVDGFAAARYLRPPEPAPVEALLHQVVSQWLRFERGRASEEVDPWRGYVGEMWRTVDARCGYDGASKFPNGEDVPWSAAFISHVVRAAGAGYAGFRVAPSHSVFVNQAIRARLGGDAAAPFWGYRIAEMRPGLGDIVARNRAGHAFTYDFAATHSRYDSHSDVVVETNERTIRVVGGNVRDSASAVEYRLDAQGLIAPAQQVIALLKNRAALC